MSGGAIANAIPVSVGGAAAGQVNVRSEPPTVPVTGGTTQIVALVADGSGNRLQGAPVTFSATNGSLSANSAITDANGEARVLLTTNRESTVSAIVGSRTGSTTVRAISLPSVTIALAGTVQPEVGVATTFTVTPATTTTGNPLRNVVVDFGDGSSENLGAISGATSVSHNYTQPGTYRVTATATDVDGLTGSSSIVIQVNERSSVSVSMTALPNPVSISNPVQQGLVEFNANAQAPPGSNIQSYQWDFGDGGGAFTTGGTTNHRYTVPGTYTARVIVRSTNGQTGVSERQIRVNN
jgi:PKD repeat protein